MPTAPNKEITLTSYPKHRRNLRWAVVALIVGGLPLAGCTEDPVSPPLDSGAGDTGVSPDSGVMADSGVDPDSSTTTDGGGAEACDEDSTLGDFCAYDADCNDLCFCNGNEVCQGGTCARGPAACDDGVECTFDVCDEETYACENTADDTVCDDVDVCTGTEVCDATVGCIAGVPLNCSDSDSCTLDACDPVAGCSNIIRDLDGDGFADSRCEGGMDCNDDPVSGALVNPDATEICDDGLDNNCDGIADLYDEVACAPSNDTCGTATHLSGPGLYAINTGGLRDDYALDCEQSGSNRDGVFTFTTTTTRDIIISLPGAPTGTTIELRDFSTCDTDGAQLDCDRDTSSYNDEAFIEHSGLPAGDYAIVVASPISAYMNLNLEVLSPVPPPRTDLCDASTPVISASTAITGDMTVVADDYPQLDCHGTYYSIDDVDAVYRLSITTDADVKITAQGIRSGGYTTPIAVAVVRDCGDPVASAEACELSLSSTPATIDFVPLPVGEYFIILEPERSSTLGYTLDVDITIPEPPIPGDTCDNALDVTAASATVDIAHLRNDGGLGCGGGTLAYRDANFYFDLAVQSDVVVTTNAPTFHLYAASTVCTDTATEFVCQPSAATGAGNTTLSDLAPGRYYLSAAVPTDMGNLDVSTVITPR